MTSKSFMLPFVELYKKTARVKTEVEVTFSREFQRAKATGATDMLAREIAVEATGAKLTELEAIMRVIELQMLRETRRPFSDNESKATRDKDAASIQDIAEATNDDAIGFAD